MSDAFSAQCGAVLSRVRLFSAQCSAGSEHSVLSAGQCSVISEHPVRSAVQCSAGSDYSVLSAQQFSVHSMLFFSAVSIVCAMGGDGTGLRICEIAKRAGEEKFSPVS